MNNVSSANSSHVKYSSPPASVNQSAAVAEAFRSYNTTISVEEKLFRLAREHGIEWVLQGLDSLQPKDSLELWKLCGIYYHIANASPYNEQASVIIHCLDGLMRIKDPKGHDEHIYLGIMSISCSVSRINATDLPEVTLKIMECIRHMPRCSNPVDLMRALASLVGKSAPIELRKTALEELIETWKKFGHSSKIYFDDIIYAIDLSRVDALQPHKFDFVRLAIASIGLALQKIEEETPSLALWEDRRHQLGNLKVIVEAFCPIRVDSPSYELCATALMEELEKRLAHHSLEIRPLLQMMSQTRSML